MKQNKDGMIEIELTEIEKKYGDVIEHLDASGICLVTKEGERQFYLIHTEVYEEMEMQLSLYQKAFEELEDFKDDMEEQSSKQHQS